MNEPKTTVVVIVDHPPSLAPITSAMSLDTFGTVTFGADFIEETIDYDEETSRRIVVTDWLDFVPILYRARALGVACEVLPEFAGRIANQRTLREFAHVLSARLAKNIVPQQLTGLPR